MLLITLSGIIGYGADGIRGTDQYWYLHDVQTLQEGISQVTNIYYPGNVLRQNGVDDNPNYFLHNGPLLHLIAKISQPNTAFDTWIILNVICHLVVAASIFLIALKYTNLEIASWTTSFYFISPIAVWQASNMLQEQFLAGLIALILVTYTYHKYLACQLILIATLLVGILSHPLYFVLAILYCLTAFTNAICSKQYVKLIFPAALVFLFFLTKVNTNLIYPSSFQPNLMTIIGGAIPGVTNMLWQFSDYPLSVDIPLLINKLSALIKSHLFSLRDAPLYIYTNLGILSGVFLLISNTRKYLYILFPCLACLGLYLAIVVLMQIQPRYQQIVASASFIMIALSAYELRHWLGRRPVKIFISGLFVSSILLSFYMLHTVRKQSQQEAQAMIFLRSIFDDIPINERVLLLDSQHELFLGYVLAPRKVLTIKTPLISSESANKAIRLFRPMHLITTQSNAADAIPHNNTDSIEVPDIGTFYRFRLNLN